LSLRGASPFGDATRRGGSKVGRENCEIFAIVVARISNGRSRIRGLTSLKQRLAQFHVKEGVLLVRVLLDDLQADGLPETELKFLENISYRDSKERERERGEGGESQVRGKEDRFGEVKGQMVAVRCYVIVTVIDLNCKNSVIRR